MSDGTNFILGQANSAESSTKLVRDGDASMAPANRVCSTVALPVTCKPPKSITTLLVKNPQIPNRPQLCPAHRRHRGRSSGQHPKLHRGPR